MRYDEPQRVIDHSVDVRIRFVSGEDRIGREAIVYIVLIIPHHIEYIVQSTSPQYRQSPTNALLVSETVSVCRDARG